MATQRARIEESYTTGFGVGKLVLYDGMPVRHDLPSAGRDALPPAPDRSPWAARLERYFDGEPGGFADLDVAAYAAYARLTAFEADVLAAVARVPYGSVVSYGQLAAAAGHPGAHRAVGSVMARNEIPVLLPCHRVVLADGRLGRYGDDPAWKRRLLELEGVVVSDDRLVTAPGSGGRR